jgi:prepilin-type N-terminal cleavage/methylation domain-containing protein
MHRSFQQFGTIHRIPNHSLETMKLPHRKAPRFPLHFAKRSPGFTLVELLVTITIVVVLAGLGFTGTSKAIASAKEVDAIQDLKSLHTATALYTADNNGELFFVLDSGGPNGWENLWINKLTDSLPNQGKVTQQSGRNPAFYNNKVKETGNNTRWIADYAPNDNVIFNRNVNNPRFPLKLSRIDRPSQEVMFVEGANNYPPNRLPNNTGAFTIWAKQAVIGDFEYPNTIARRHGGDKNPAFYAIYCDGHTERISFKKFASDRTLRQTMFSANQNGDTIY